MLGLLELLVLLAELDSTRGLARREREGLFSLERLAALLDLALSLAMHCSEQ